MIISGFKFLVSVVTYFWPNLMKCPKMGSNCQIFASLLAEKTVLNHIKHIIILTEFQEMGSFGALNLHSMTFKC